MESAPSFADMTGTEWYAHTVGLMAHLGIIQGYNDNTFRGDDYITRAEFAAMISRFEALRYEGENAFSDVPQTHWAVEPINAVAEKGWVYGYENGTFQPEQYITRAQTVVVINRMLERVWDEEYVTEHIEELTMFSDVAQTHWAYGDIVEAANGLSYAPDQDGVEVWTGIQG